MDSTWSASAVAAELGTSVPRVVRAAKRLGFDSRQGKGRLALAPEEVQRIRDELGISVRIHGMSPTEVAVLATLARASLGLPSARAVALRSGLSPTAASGAIESLLSRGLVRREPALIAAGRARRVLMLHANRSDPRYSEMASALRNVRPPRRTRDERVPSRLTHLFWNTNPAQLDVARGGRYIARRLLRTQDPEGLAWGARSLRPEHWLAAAEARGLDPPTRALARNLASESDL
jgi:predicted transcriptional regulator